MNTPIYDEAAWDAGFAPLPATGCPSCSNGSGVVCAPCAHEIATRMSDPDDELVSVFYSGHGINHTSYRPDVTR